MRVLVAEDDAGLRSVIDRGLRENGYVVDTVADGVDALAHLDAYDYEAVVLERRSLDSAPITPEVLDLAIDLQHELAKRGQHRLAIPDVIISAAARSAGLVVLHYDADFERVGAVGGAEQEWVAPRGSL